MGEERHVYEFFVGNPEGHCLGKLGIDEIILKSACCVQLVHLSNSCGFGKPMVHRVLIAWFLAILL
jgi:hypothetical protein